MRDGGRRQGGRGRLRRGGRLLASLLCVSSPLYSSYVVVLHSRDNEDQLQTHTRTHTHTARGESLSFRVCVLAFVLFSCVFVFAVTICVVRARVRWSACAHWACVFACGTIVVSGTNCAFMFLSRCCWFLSVCVRVRVARARLHCLSNCETKQTKLKSIIWFLLLLFFVSSRCERWNHGRSHQDEFSNKASLWAS